MAGWSIRAASVWFLMWDFQRLRFFFFSFSNHAVQVKNNNKKWNVSVRIVCCGQSAREGESKTKHDHEAEKKVTFYFVDWAVTKCTVCYRQRVTAKCCSFSNSSFQTVKSLLMFSIYWKIESGPSQRSSYSSAKKEYCLQWKCWADLDSIGLSVCLTCSHQECSDDSTDILDSINVRITSNIFKLLIFFCLFAIFKK